MVEEGILSIMSLIVVGKHNRSQGGYGLLQLPVSLRQMRMADAEVLPKDLTADMVYRLA